MEVLGGLGDWSNIGIGAAVVFAIVLGRLIPLSTHKSRIDDKNEVIRKLEAALDKRDEQFNSLFKQTELIIGLIEDLKRAEQRSKTGSV